jgi:hypothetical protein
MPAIDFPNSPSAGTQHSSGGRVWEYDGTAWSLLVSYAPTTIGTGTISASQLAATAAIKPTIMNAAGDLIVATSNDTPAILPIGTNGQFLKVNTAANEKMEWSSTIGQLSSLTDIDVAGAVSGEVLSYDGVDWVSSPVIRDMRVLSFMEVL